MPRLAALDGLERLDRLQPVIDDAKEMRLRGADEQATRRRSHTGRQAVTDRQIIARYAGAHEELHAANEELRRQIRAHEEWRAARYSSPVDPLSPAVERGLIKAILYVPLFGMIVAGIVHILSIR